MENFSSLPSVDSLSGNEIVPCFEPDAPVGGTGRKATVDQLVSFVQSETGLPTGITASATEINTLVGVTDGLSSVVDGVQAYLTIDGGADGNDGITYTAKSYVKAEGEAITIAHLGGTDKAFSISVVGSAITIQLATTGTTVTTTPVQINAALATPVGAGAIAAAALVTSGLSEGNGTSKTKAQVATPLANGVDVTPGPVGGWRFKDDGSEGYVKVSDQVWKYFALTAIGA